MTEKIRVVHYINQFFAGIGGEDKADAPPERRAGAVGARCALQAAFGQDAEIVATILCGDTSFKRKRRSNRRWFGRAHRRRQTRPVDCRTRVRFGTLWHGMRQDLCRRP